MSFLQGKEGADENRWQSMGADLPGTGGRELPGSGRARRLDDHVAWGEAGELIRVSTSELLQEIERGSGEELIIP
jgi:hypothetical protein